MGLNTTFAYTDWHSREHHESFAASPAYKPWLQRLDTAIDTSKAKFHHVDFQPLGSLVKVVGAHVTEITTFFCGDATPAEDCDGSPAEAWLYDVAQVVRSMGGEDSLRWYGLTGLVFGVTHEELSSRDGGQGRRVLF
jgi:hypothetical protein